MKLKQTFFYTVTAVVLSFALLSCNSNTSEKKTKSGVMHFRLLQFSETPFDIEKGTHELTDKEARTVNNYKFTYDVSGRLTEVAYCRGDEILSYGSLGGAARITYTYDGDKQVKHFYNKVNEPITSGGVFSAEYTLDDKGFRTGLVFFDKDGNPVENRNNINYYTWKELENGLLQERRYNLANEETILNPFCPFYELRFTYDDQGYAIRMSNYQADTLYNCTAVDRPPPDNRNFEFKNNNNGDLLSFSVHNTVGQLSNLYWGWAKRLNKVDDNGYVVETAMYDQDDEYLSGKNVPVTQYVYDEHGAPIKTKSLDKDRNLINNPNNGVATTEYKYDDKGNRVETLKLDKEGVAVAND